MDNVNRKICATCANGKLTGRKTADSVSVIDCLIHGLVTEITTAECSEHSPVSDNTNKERN